MILITLVFSLSIFLLKLGYVSAQIFIRDCNDPLIVGHTMRFGHSYCFHACGGLTTTIGTAVCGADGSCDCPCSATGPESVFDPDVCPPRAGDDPDPDPTALPRCMASCAGKCAGGQGMICGEVQVFQQGGQNVFAKLCTCICPRASCTPTTTTTTTTTLAPPVNITLTVPVAVAVIKPKLILKKILFLIKKGILYNLVIFGTIFKLFLLGLSALPLILFFGFTFNMISTFIEQWMFASMYGMMRIGQYMMNSYMYGIQ